MSRANISATSARTMGVRKGTEQPVRRAPRGAEKVTVPFPDAWADAWDSYEYTKLAEGQSPNSVRTRRSSVLRLARMYSDREPEKITRRDIERHITAMRKTLKPATVFGAFHDLRSFFGWLAQETRAANIMDGMKHKTPGMADVPVLSEAQLKALLGSCKGEGIIALRDKAIILLFLETGIRRMDLQNLMLSDVNLKEGTCYIRRGKGGRPRVAIFGPATSDALSEVPARGESHQGKALGRRRFPAVPVKVRRRTGVRGSGGHAEGPGERSRNPGHAPAPAPACLGALLIGRARG
jgi:integrase